MTYTIAKQDFLLINLNFTELINMPTQFTSVEAISLEEKFKNFHKSYMSIKTDLDNFTKKRIIIDFRATTFMDNEGLIGLCKILHFAKQKKIDLSFLHLSPQVRIIFSLAGIENHISFENSR